MTKTRRVLWLDDACNGEPELRCHVDELLRSHEAKGFMRSLADSFSVDSRLAMLKPEERGDQIGLYRLLEQIGEGGFGTVWVADQQKPIRRRVALKIIKLGMDTKEVIARFEQERQALAIMDHPNIARILDAGATPFGRPFFAMELVRGIRITDYCDQAKLSTEDRVKLFVTVCHAVQHAHQKGIIHRDLKPSNILVTLQDGMPVPKIIDFGVAKATQGRLGDHSIYTQFRQMLGTPIYMSPEQAGMTSHDIDTRSDIYGLGVLLYELLTGRTPIAQESVETVGFEELRRLICEVDPPRPSTKLKTLSHEELTTTAKRRLVEPLRLPTLVRGDLDLIVMKCLEKDRNRRYSSASELAQDLERHLRSEIVSARPPTTGYLLLRLIRRHRFAFIVVVAVILAFILGFAASVWVAVRATKMYTQAQIVETRALVSLDKVHATSASLVREAETAKAKGNYAAAFEKLNIAIQLLPDVAEYRTSKADLLLGQWNVLDAAQAYTEALRLDPKSDRAQVGQARCESLIRSLATMPFSLGSMQRLAAEINTTYRRPVEGDSIRPQPQTSIAATAVCPSGSRIARCNQGELRVWDVTTGRSLWAVPTDRDASPRPRAIAFSPDGTRIVLGTTKTTKVFDANTGRELTNLGQNYGATAVTYSSDGQWLVTSDGATLRMRHENTGAVLLNIGHDVGVNSVGISRDNNRVFTSSENGKLRVWDVPTGQELFFSDL